MDDPSPYATALNTIMTALLTAAVPIITGSIVAVALKLQKKFGLDGIKIDKANMETELNAALQFGIVEVLPVIRARGWDDPEVKKQVLDSARDYFRQRFPDRTKLIETANDSTSSTPVRDTLSARLPDAMTTAAASPATPPAPPAATTP